MLNPTCEEDGEKIRTCEVCSEIDKDKVEALGHALFVFDTTSPTCVKTGTKTYRCSHKVNGEMCDYEYTEQVAALGHYFTKINITKEPTCTEEGEHTSECNRCGDTITASVPAKGHSYGSWTETKAATCTEVGSHYRVCTVAGCGDVQTEDIPALGHSYVTGVHDPTCTEQGYTEYECERCKDTYIGDYVDMLPHEIIVESEIEATCTMGGYTRKVCKNCNWNEQTNTEALGHNYVEGKTYEVSCTQDGYTEKKCSRCNDEIKENFRPAYGHEVLSWEQTKDPTCTTAGIEEGVCVREIGHDETTDTPILCGENVTREIAATGHTADSSWTITKNPTCTEPGVKSGTCTVCNQSGTIEIPANGHSVSTWTTNTEATCDQAGERQGTCSVCNNLVVEEVAPLGHISDSWTVLEEPTCSNNGSKSGHCTRCNSDVTVQIEALGHSYEAIVTAPTCLDRGYTTHICKRIVEKKKNEGTDDEPGEDIIYKEECGEYYIDSYKNALGHNKVTDARVEPTCTTTGLTEGSHCSRCGLVYVAQQVIAKLGHDYSIETVVAPTETEKGYTLHKCSRCDDSYKDNWTDPTGSSEESS